MKGVRFYFSDRMSQFVPDASMKEIIKKINDNSKGNWLSFGDQIIINLKKVNEFCEEEK